MIGIISILICPQKKNIFILILLEIYSPQKNLTENFTEMIFFNWNLNLIRSRLYEIEGNNLIYYYNT